MDTLGARLKKARTNAKLTQQRVADEFGIARVNISQWESDTTRPDGYKLPALAKLYDVPEEWLRGDDTEAPTRTRGAPPVFVPGSDLVRRERNLPVYAASMGGDGHVIITFDPIEYVKRPAVLEHVKDGYGVLIVGESMVPAYRPGDTALVNPRLPPQRESDVVLFHTPPNGDAECIIKQLNGFNDEVWHLEQFNPASQFDEYRREWPICHRVVGKYNRR